MLAQGMHLVEFCIALSSIDKGTNQMNRFNNNDYKSLNESIQRMGQQLNEDIIKDIGGHLGNIIDGVGDMIRTVPISITDVLTGGGSIPGNILMTLFDDELRKLAERIGDFIRELFYD